MHLRSMKVMASIVAAAITLAPVTPAFADRNKNKPPKNGDTTTPIKHLVVIFGENVSFDHYFATYPDAQNDTAGEHKFNAKNDTPSVNGLGGIFLELNPNLLNTQNGTGATSPFRLARSQAN